MSVFAMEVEQAFFRRSLPNGVIQKTMVHGRLTGKLIRKDWKQIEATDYIALTEAKHVWLDSDGEEIILG